MSTLAHLLARSVNSKCDGCGSEIKRQIGWGFVGPAVTICHPRSLSYRRASDLPAAALTGLAGPMPEALNKSSSYIVRPSVRLTTL